MRKPEPERMYQFKVTLNDIHPLVWRRIWISDKSTLLDLHDVIQDVFGWLDYHLHEFRIEEVRYGDPANDEMGDLDIQDEVEIKLRRLNLQEGARFTYEYDFGDSWEHTLVLEKILPLEKGMKLPQCLEGKRACPPEDVGGPPGYAEFLRVIHNPRHEEHDRYLEWAGGAFDPEAFDLDAVNERIRQRRKPTWPGKSHPEYEAGPTGQKSPRILSGWETQLGAAGRQIAEDLPLRKDGIAFLQYIQENRVTGTQSTGNLPRKVIEAVVARLVNPPVLEERIGDAVFRFQNEGEVWPVYFVHVLAEAGGLVSGGPGRRWRLTPDGEQFFTLAPASQVGILFAAWWLRVNWLVAVPYDFFGGELPEHFRKTVAACLLELPVGEPILFESFADRVIEKVGWTWQKQEPDSTRMILRASIEHTVIDPLADFGILTVQKEQDPRWRHDAKILISFTLTRFGRALLETVREAG